MRFVTAMAALGPLVGMGACASIVGAHFDRGGSVDDDADIFPSDGDAAVLLPDGAPAPRGSDAGAESGSPDGGPSTGGGDDDDDDGSVQMSMDGGGTAAATYDTEQAFLAAKRFAGPKTTEGATGFCTDDHFVWKETSGALHSWSASDHSSIDYAFTTERTSFFGPGESYLPVLDSANKIDVYKTTEANDEVATLPYVYATAGVDDGLILVALVDGDLSTKQIEHWYAADGGTTTIGSSLPAAEPPSSFGRSEMVIPGGSTIPFPIYITNVATGALTTVTFDGALALDQTLSSADGLLTWYVRTGSVSEIRLYKGNDTNEQIELGSEIDALPGLYPDSPDGEHDVVAHLATDGDAVIYGSAFGIFAYGMKDGNLAPLQLAADKKVGVPDILCVVPNEHLLMYRTQGDSTLQVYALPLAGLLP